MNALLRTAAGLALVAALPAAPSSDLGSEILLQREGGNGFALVDRATGVLRSGTIQGGDIVWQHQVDTGMAAVSDVAGGLPGTSGELVAVTTPLANRVALVEVDASFPAMTRFSPRNIGPRAVAEIFSGGSPEMLLSCTLNGQGLDDTLEVQENLTTGGNLLANDDSLGAVPKLEPLYDSAAGRRIAVYTRPSGVETELGIALRDTTMLVPRGAVSGTWPQFATNVRASGGELLVLLFDPGSDEVIALETTLPIDASTTFGSPVSVHFPFPVGSIVPVAPGDPNMPDGVIASSADGRSLAWCRISAAGSAAVEKEFNDRGVASFLGGILVPGAGLLRFEGEEPGAPASVATAYEWNGGWELSDQVEVPTPAEARNRTATLFYFDSEPLTDEHARLLSIESVPDWTRKQAADPLPADVLKESFGGGTSGLGSPSLTPTHPPFGAGFLLTNQVGEGLSLAALEPGVSLFEPGLRIEPPSGSYPSTVAVTASYDDRLYQLYFRNADPGARWNPWPGSLQVAHPADYLFVLVHRTGSTATGRIIQRSYLIDPAGIAAADGDSDGVPDYVEQSLGLDPTAGADSDGDGASDLEEILAGTNPADPGSVPDPRDPVPQGEGFELVALPFSVSGDEAVDDTEVAARSSTGAFLGRAGVATIPPAELPGIGRGAWISASTAVPSDEWVVLSSGDFFSTDNGSTTVDEGREIRAMLETPAPPVPTISFTPTGVDLAADAAGWIAAAQAAYSSYAPVETGTDLVPHDTAVSVLVEQMILSAGRNLGLLDASVTLHTFTAFPDRVQDADRTPIDESLVAGLRAKGVDFHAFLELARNAVTGPDPGAVALRATADGIYAHHVANFDTDRSLALPLDVLRIVLAFEPLPDNYAGAVSPADLLAAQAAADDAVSGWPSTRRPIATWTVEIPGLSPGHGVYLRQPGGLEVELFDGAGRVFPLEQERALVPGSQFHVTGFTDVSTTSGRDGMEVYQVVTGFLPAASNRDQDGNLLDDQWERFFCGATGQDPFQVPPGSAYSLLQHFLEGTDPRSNGADEPSVPVVTVAPGRLAIARGDGGFDLRFGFPATYLDRFDFVVEASETLEAGSFEDLAGTSVAEDPPGSDQVIITVPEDPTKPRRFYRVRIVLR